MTFSLQDEIKNALWGCVEIPLYLRRGVTRFAGTIPAVKRSFLIPLVMIPVIIITVPQHELFTDKSFMWLFVLYMLQVVIGTGLFMAVTNLFKPKETTNEQYFQTIAAYNWLSLPSYIVNVPLLLLGYAGVHTWDDVFAMMLLVTFYCYSYVAYMIMHTLRTNGFIAVTTAILDLMLGEVIRNLTSYFMLHYV